MQHRLEERIVRFLEEKCAKHVSDLPIAARLGHLNRMLVKPLRLLGKQLGLQKALIMRVSRNGRPGIVFSSHGTLNIGFNILYVVY